LALRDQIGQMAADALERLGFELPRIPGRIPPAAEREQKQIPPPAVQSALE
jgi:hypothetical protein